MSLTTLSLLTLAACATPFPGRDFPDDPSNDYDGDGVTESAGDCDDRDATAYPGATWYRDQDGDQYGDPTVPTQSCTPPSGFVADATDCDDAVSGVHPGALETCTPYDDDCDGSTQVPDDAALPTWYLDADADGFGSPTGETRTQCDQPTGFVYDSSDCNDRDASVRPRAPELCDDQDNDCDGSVDDADPDALEGTPWYADADGDGWGTSADTVAACAAPEGRVAEAGDCDDTSRDVSPDVPEQCDGLDQDCDGRVDDGVQASFYADLDGDGFGDASGTVVDACAAPSGFTDDFSDCDDTRTDVSPDAPELCDGVDNDCDITVDEPSALDAETWYADADTDTYGDADNLVRACDPPAGYLSSAGDCDDARASVHPGASETCATGIDDDCDGSTNDADAVGCRDFYADADTDGFGGTDRQCQCTPDTTYAARVGGDCDDARALVNPDANETCGTSYDDDCDGDANDLDAATCTYFFVDVDADGYGDDAARGDALCLCAGEGYNTTIAEGDCDDTLAGVSPAATEYCDAVDENCNGSVDDDAVDALTWYEDSDSDRFGNASRSRLSCDAPTNFVADATDCEDGRANVYPGATETCFTLYDDDCDTDGNDNDPGATGCTTYYSDVDGDGYGTSLSLCLCEDEGAYTSRTRNDCDDADAARDPGNSELCSTPVDDDCDGSVNEAGASDCTNYFADVDGDRYGTASTQCLCAPSGTYSATATGDCNDADPSVNTGAGNCGLVGELDDSDAISRLDNTFEPAAAGFDFNGDGLGDLVFGHSGYDTSYTDVGRIWVFYGPMPAIMDLDGSSSADLVLTADGTFQLGLGGWVQTGDFDGDGQDELLASGVADTSTSTRTPSAWLFEYAGTGTGVLNYRDTGTNVGTAVVGGINVGDVNGDGADDVVGSDRVVYWGGSGSGTGLFASSGVTLGSSTYQCASAYPSNCLPRRTDVTDTNGDGASDAGVDWNGDGLADIITAAGIYFGRTTPVSMSGTPDVLWLGAPYYYATSYTSLQAITDWNDDGYGDTVTGAPETNETIYDARSGAVYYYNVGRFQVHLGGLSLTSSSAFTMTGALNSHQFASSIISAGDLDGDDRTDIWIGSYGTTCEYSGVCVALVYGGATGSGTATTSGVGAWLPRVGRAHSYPKGFAVPDTDGDGYSESFVFSFPSTSNPMYSFLFPGQPR